MDTKEKNEQSNKNSFLTDAWDAFRLHILGLIDSIQAKIEKLTTKIQQNETDMGNGKLKLEKIDVKVEKLFGEVRMLRNELNELRNELNELRNEMQEMQIDFVKIGGAKNRALTGGSIMQKQPQDLLNDFYKLKTKINSLAVTVKGNPNQAKIDLLKSVIAKILIKDWQCEKWLSEIIAVISSFEDFHLYERDESLENSLKKFYDDVQNFKTSMTIVVPISTFDAPEVGEPFNPELYSLSSQQCDSEKAISVVIFPGLKIGDDLEVKAVVFTAY